MTCRRERSRHGRVGRRHPTLEHALLERDLAEAGLRLEDVFLTRGFEILRDGLLERWFILGNKAGHPIQLLDPPLIAPRRTRREVPLLPVK